MKKRLKYIIPLALFVALVAIFISDIVDIWPQLTSGSEEAFEKAIEDLGPRGAIILALIQMTLVLVVFIPSEFVQIVSGVTYGIGWGTLINITGILLGATIIYVLVNMFRVKADIDNSSTMDTINALSKKRHSVAKLTLILFFMPAIPYGAICYYAAGKDLKYWRYALICIVGNLPSVLIDTFMGSAFTALITKYMGWVVVGVLVFTVVVILIVNIINKRRVNKILYGEPNPTFAKIMETRKPKQPDEGIYKFMYNTVGKMYTKRNKITIINDDIKDIKEPCLVLCTHPSKPDFIYTALSIWPKKPNMVANYYYFYYPMLRKLFVKMGVIPKKLFTTDSRTIKDMFSVARAGNDIMMMPEGRLSICGTNLPMPCGLDKLVKKIGMPVITIRPHGAYLTGAKWMKSKRHGRIEIEARLTLTKDEVASQDTEYIHNKLKSALEYDDFKWNETAQVEYKGKSLCKGVEGILYICPYCNSKYTLKGVKNRIECGHCGSVVNMNKKYIFTDPPREDIKNIRDWYHFQMAQERNNLQNPDYCLTTAVIVKTYSDLGNGLKVVGEGNCYLTTKGLVYKGTFKGKDVEEFVPPEELQALLFGCDEDFELYHNGEFYYFQPKQNRLQCVEWSLVSELIHEINVEKIEN